MGRVIRIVQKRVYDVVVGLGSCCQTAYQLYRLGFRGVAYPFDWLVLSFNGLYKILENRFLGFLGREDLELRRDKYILDKRYGVKLLHDFKYKKDFVWLEDYQVHYDKYWRRINRFLELMQSGKQVLFVRRECRKEQAIKLQKMIKRVYPGLEFGLLILDETEEIKNGWNLLGIWNEYLRQRNPYEWHGINEEWDRVMSNFKIPKI